jgi:light-regulated signal transduction histidine kinase (bacteriophytochrome)
MRPTGICRYRPVPMLGAPRVLPLDMSHAALRSVSPIHIEYLKNMGEGASMSVSIVINGPLWALIACHHMWRKLVPYSIRMAADVLAQVEAPGGTCLRRMPYRSARAAW